jgi:hypothetical protein
MKTVLIALATAIATASLIAGCGSSGGDTTSAPEPLKRVGDAGGPAGASVRICASSGEGLQRIRVTGVSCRQGSIVLLGWASRPHGCAPRRGASRSSCSVEGYRCLSVRTSRGLAVNCARRGRSISFIRV